MSVRHAQSPGRRRASANIHSALQAAGRLNVARSHATKSATIACNTTPLEKCHKPRHTCNMPLLHSQFLRPNFSHLPIPLSPPPPTSLKPPFHKTSSRASAQREYPQSHWIDTTEGILHFYIHGSLNQSQIEWR